MAPPSPLPEIVHEGRGGYLALGERRYPIEHAGEGRFVIHLPARCPAAHRDAVEALIASAPDRWAVARR